MTGSRPAAPATAGLTVGFDATPLLGRRTGVGVYTARVTDALAATAGLRLTATAFTTRGAGRLAAEVPPGVGVRHRPVPARALRLAWSRREWPPVELLCGRVDVFHATNFVLPPARRAQGVVTVHDLSFLLHPDTVAAATSDYRVLVPQSLRRAAVVCTPSHAVAAEVVEHYGVAADRVVVTPLGVEAAWFDARPAPPALTDRLGLPTAGGYAVAVGTLEPRKNLDVLLDAHETVWRSGLQVPLVLVGAAGWGAPPTLDRRPAGSVVTTGYLADDELRAVTAGARLLAFPSRYEGFGLPPLEALAAGVPVVAADLAVTREVLGDRARFVPPRDVGAWSDALRDVLTGEPDPAARAAGRRHAATYTWDRCAAATVGAYRAALA